MSIIERTTKLMLTQFKGSSVKPALLDYYTADMKKIDDAFLANDDVLASYDSRLDAIELVIETVSTANIDHLTERVDALEQKVEINSELISKFNDDLDAIRVRVSGLEAADLIHGNRLTALENRVTTLEGCCEDVRGDIATIVGRLDDDDVLLTGLRVDVDKNRHDIEQNARDITIIATQEQINAENINKIFDDIPVDEIIALAELSEGTLSAKGLTFSFAKRGGWCRVNITGTTSEVIENDLFNEEVPTGYLPVSDVGTVAVQPWDIINSQFCIKLDANGKIEGVVNGDSIAIGTTVNHFATYPVADET